MLVGTNNMGKLTELRRLLGEADVELVTLREAGVREEVEEDGLTFLANAQKKAREYALASGLATLADDSGLVVRALAGRPGVESANYGGPGLTATERNQLLLRELDGTADRRAEYVCVIALARPGGPAASVFMGRCEGRIGRHPVGESGFGYDPVFVLPDGRSMAEVSPADKDVLSHRGRAVAELLAQFDLARFAQLERTSDG
ncbi:MAG: RdgB/HAM1 family non-canonical purine NTP pyrophosphatase [Candidatus Dormibacteria bacterium]